LAFDAIACIDAVNHLPIARHPCIFVVGNLGSSRAPAAERLTSEHDNGTSLAMTF
jgi:hypothetical protein